MHIVRYRQEPHSPPIWGWLSGDQIGKLDGSPFDEFKREEAVLPLESTHLLPPVNPSKIICVGLNYPEHAIEHETEVPEIPLLFLKPPSSIIGPGETIFLPPQSQRIEHEAELAIVISQPGRWISPDDADDHILGYTVANDVTARDLQRLDRLWTRGKGFDTFCPIGPWIDTDLDPADALITCAVNGQMRQMASTRDMVFTVNHLVAFISSVMTLESGDVILTGTPSGVGLLLDEDVVTINIEGLGTLTNPVQADKQGE
ncbi:MAG: fumarylacetoacetate hydrolase family protein [Anaerolineales bacterium]|nr:fumarylacetoacetate hydrolase family protein [Anaerolineales bacterium]